MANHGGKRPGAGRPVANHTLQAAEARKNLIAMYVASAQEINSVLISKAIEGDMVAIKELHDRVYGKALQTTENTHVNKVKIDDPELERYAEGLTRLQKENTGSPRTET